MEIMRESLQVAPKYKNFMTFVDPDHPFVSVCDYFGFKLEDAKKVRSQVVQAELPDPDGDGAEKVYFKLYGYESLRRALPRSFKPSRSKGEFDNLSFFHQLSIPACDPMVQGEYRSSLGLISHCLIITREVENTMRLDHFIEQLESGSDSDEIKKDIKKQIIRSLAANLKKIHEKRFFHNDMKWRNVLIRREGNRVDTFWIDCPNGYFDNVLGLRRKHGMIKDIATLDHLAWRKCSDEDRMYFISCYTGLKLDDPELRKFGQAVVDYRKRRLDD